MGNLRGRRGGTLVEVTVALTLLCVGVLGIAATSLATHRLLDGGRWATRLTFLGGSRLELLRSAAEDSATCRRAQSGTRSLGAAREQWSATPAAAGLQLQTAVDRQVPGAVVADTLHILVWCP